MVTVLFAFSEIVSISLLQQGVILNSCDQKEYSGRSVYYWRRALLSLKTIQKHQNVPEPTDPLFKHFHSVDIQVQIDSSEMRGRGVVCHKLTDKLVVSLFFWVGWCSVLMVGCFFLFFVFCCFFERLNSGVAVRLLRMRFGGIFLLRFP